MTEIFINAKAATMDEDRPQAEAFAVRDGRFSFVGTGEEARAHARKLEAEGESAAVTDLAGRCVLPAFNDSHMHFIGFAKHFINVDLNGASGIREIRERIRRRAKERGSADTSWMEGTGWNQASSTPPARKPRLLPIKSC